MDGTWKVGAVAETSGLTVRTLHHWDEIGLLSPTLRSDGGHRAYTADDLARLYVILVLRDLGLPLESIRTCLAAPVDAPRLLTDQLAQLDATIEQLGRLRARVADVRERAGAGTHLGDPRELLTLMRDARPGVQALLDRHLDDEERAALAEGAAQAGPALPYLLEVEWPQLYREADALRRDGVPADDPRMRRIATRLDELSALVGGSRDGQRPHDTAGGATPGSGGAPSGGGVRRAWREDPAAMSGQPAEVAASWRDLADYVEQARAARR